MIQQEFKNQRHVHLRKVRHFNRFVAQLTLDTRVKH